MAVYIFGMLLENETMVQKLQEWTNEDNNLCWTLGQLLLKDDPDVVLNAAGAIVSLVTHCKSQGSPFYLFHF